MKNEAFLKLKEKYSASLQKEARPIVIEMFKDFQKANPEISKIAWHQGTPSFNDGAPCTFELYDMTFFNGEKEYGYYDRDIPAHYDTFYEKLQSNLDMLHYAFGDGAKIAIEKENIVVEDWRNDDY